jgi:hypothetical protein
MNNEHEAEPVDGESSVLVEEKNPFEERAKLEAAKPKKASLLSSVTTRKRRRPIFGVVYGQSGIGKST